MKTEKPTSGAKRGRKPGSVKKHTTKGADSLMNTIRAHWGERGGSKGSFVAHQEWIDRHPRASLCELRAKARNEDPEAYRARFTEEMRAEPLNPVTQEMIRDAIYARDWRFFEDMADCLRRLNPDGSIAYADPVESALLNYINWNRWDRDYTRGELLKSVEWPKDGNGCSLRPSLRSLDNLISKFRIRIKKGRGKKSV